MYYISRQVYLGNVVANTLPPPPPIFPPITFPRHATHGIPKAQAVPPTGTKPPKSSATRATLPPSEAGGQEVESTEVDDELDVFKQKLLEVTPGSEAAEDLMQDLEKTAHRIAKRKGQTVFTITAVFAKALWRKAQGISNAWFSIHN